MAEAELVERIVRLTAEVERIPDPAARALAEDLSAAVLALHGQAIERLLSLLGDDARRRVAADPVVAGVLLIHDLHPEPLEARVQAGLDAVRPYMASHGGDVELLGIEDGVARLRLVGSCDGCAASSSTLELAVEKALEEAAPDLLGMEVEGAVGALAATQVTGAELPMVPLGAAGNGSSTSAEHAPGLSDWRPLDGVADLASDELCVVEIGGDSIVVARVDGSLLAYRDLCVACDEPLAGGALSAGVLTCPACARRYFLPRAGRSLDDERVQLQPVPLLVERGAGAKVALA